MEPKINFWSMPLTDLLAQLNTGENGICEEEASKRRKLNKFITADSPFKQDLWLILGQFKSPLVLILIISVILSSLLGEYTNSFLILLIILFSGLTGFWQERKANHAASKLLESVQTKASVLRNGQVKEIPATEVTIGDVILLNAGDIIPGDCRLLESNDLHVNEAPLTGESFPQEKQPAILPEDTPLSKRVNCVFYGTNVINGTAKALVVATGTDTQFGSIAAELGKKYPETAFESGIKKFGYLLMQITLILAFLVFSLNVYLGKPLVDSFFFGLALALGMTPELLPAIITVTLSVGAKRMADKKVIVKRLASIQNFGSIDILCADKTGTLTEGVVQVQGTVDIEGIHSDKVQLYAYLNAVFETGFTNPLDDALRTLTVNTDGFSKFDEVPFDFVRKRLSIVVADNKRHIMITKGAVKNILEVCDQVELQENMLSLVNYKEQILSKHEAYSMEGYRTIGICYKDVTSNPVISKDDENHMVFIGFVILADPPKAGIADSLEKLKQAGVSIKLITGDNQFVAAHLSKQIGLHAQTILTGADLRKMSDEALIHKVKRINLFAETEPYQKERLVRALRKAGYVVGFIGDGINDVSAMKAADVSISVDSAVDIAKETADIILLEKNLDTLTDGIYEGRKTFMNTMKYIYITSSANFGNMFSMAAASVFLPFLPLLPKQILLTNFLTDFPVMALPQDHVDKERVIKPARWNPSLIGKFMVIFGIESSMFDLLTFVVLLYYFQAGAQLFQTGWFVESVATEIFILMIIRTHRPIYKSVPGKKLLFFGITVIILACILPYSPLNEVLGFVPLPFSVLLSLGIITFVYCLIAEISKIIFFKKMHA